MRGEPTQGRELVVAGRTGLVDLVMGNGPLEKEDRLLA